MSIEILLIVAFGGAFVAYFLGKISHVARDAFAVLLSCVLIAFISYFYGKEIERPFYVGFLDMQLLFRLNTLSWFFAITVSTVGTLAIIFSLSYIRQRERTDFFYLICFW